MRVVSVNVSKRRPLVVNGRPVETGFFKQPVADPVAINAGGLEGDDFVTARPGGRADQAVYAYAVDHYPFWAQRLGLGELPWGRFAENLSIEGATEDRVRVGDVWRCGTARLQVSHPRLPCRKLEVTFGLTLLVEFLQSLRVGFYLRVLQPGVVRVGDEIVVERSAPGAATVADFTRLTQIDYWDHEGLRGLLAAPGLSSDWREAIEDKSQRAAAAAGWVATRPVVVEGHREESPGLVSYVVRCAFGRPLVRTGVGRGLHVVSAAAAASRTFSRSLALLTGDPDATDTYTLTMRRGALLLPPGLVLRITPPRPLAAFPAHPGGPARLVADRLGLPLAGQLARHWSTQGVTDVTVLVAEPETKGAAGAGGPARTTRDALAEAMQALVDRAPASIVALGEEAFVEAVVAHLDARGGLRDRLVACALRPGAADWPVHKPIEPLVSWMAPDPGPE